MTGRITPRDDTDGGARLRLQAWELALLHRLRDELVALLEEGESGDPAVERLFPQAVEDDEEADAELRTLIGAELLTDRLEGLDELLEILERGEDAPGGAGGGAGERGGEDEIVIDLSGEESALVLGVLNDLRLALGARAGIEDIDRSQLTEDDPIAPTVAVMDHLAWLQEQLLGVLDPPSLDFYKDMDAGSGRESDGPEGPGEPGGA